MNSSKTPTKTQNHQMNKWLNNIKLEGKLVKLEPLSLHHLEGLTDAVKDGDLWDLWYTSAPEPSSVQSYIETAMDEFANDRSLPFAIIRTSNYKIIGTTRYMHADAKNKRLEIGTTWYSKSVQRTGVNTECKYLLLQYAFEELECIAVEFRTHWHNLQSRNAIERLGAKQDGVLRNHILDKYGCLRDTVVFSILNSEWNTVKKSLEYKMTKRYLGL
ncbi:MAG: GNAT family protein [Saprospiraceae bacterium]